MVTMETYQADSHARLVQSVYSKPRTYKSRWYVLCVFAMTSCIQNCVWAGWGPIAQSAKAVYLWKDSTIDMLVNAGNIATMVFILPASWLLDEKGLRVSIVLGTVIIAVGTGIRCITYHPVSATWLIFVGQILNGIGGTMAFAAPPLLSETWFPMTERATSTGVGVLFSSVGGALAFILGPQFVSEPNSCNANTTQRNTSGSSLSSADFCNDTDISKIRGEIMTLNYLEFGMAAALAIMVLMYFPDKPPTPPSATACVMRMTFKDGLKSIVRLMPFWHLAFAFSIPSGVYGVWGSTLDVSTHQFGITQTEAGWLGFWGSLGGTLLGIVLSRFADLFQNKMKLFLISNYSLATVCYVIFTLICSRYISGNTVSIYVACISGSVLVNGAIPLFYEMACENAYPAAEGVIAGCISLVLNLTGSFVLLLSLVPNIGTAWMNWALVTAVGLTVPLMIVFVDKHHRTDIDKAILQQEHSRSATKEEHSISS